MLPNRRRRNGPTGPHLCDFPGRNDDLRSRLSQYVDAEVGGVVEDHPAFDYSTDAERDDHTVDFEALKLYRDSNFDIISQEPDVETPMAEIVEAFVNEELYRDAKTDNFVRLAEDDPTSFDTERWQNADTVEESLDYGHGLILSLAYGDMDISYPQQAGIIREAYKRHHDFDVLAWEVPMRQGSFLAGMMYSPDDDKVRTFNKGGEAWSGSGESQAHAEIQDWRVIVDPDNEARGNPTSFHHPVLFHTDEWDRGRIEFEDAKKWNAAMITDIASEEHGQHLDYSPGVFSGDTNYALTTGLQEKVSRTMLEYNTTENTDFQNIWDLANITVMLEDFYDNSNFVIDTGVDNDDYSGMFQGNIAVYDVDDSGVLDEVWSDQAGEYDNFGQAYDALAAN